MNNRCLAPVIHHSSSVNESAQATAAPAMPSASAAWTPVWAIRLPPAAVPAASPIVTDVDIPPDTPPRVPRTPARPTLLHETATPGALGSPAGDPIPALSARPP